MSTRYLSDEPFRVVPELCGAEAASPARRFSAFAIDHAILTIGELGEPPLRPKIVRIEVGDLIPKLLRALALEELDRRYEELVARLDGTYEIPR